MDFRINEALRYAKITGRKVLKKDLAARLWIHSTPESQVMNMTSLCSGKTQSIRPEWVDIICGMCGVSADFLFNTVSTTQTVSKIISLPARWHEYLMDEDDEVPAIPEAAEFLSLNCPRGFYLSDISLYGSCSPNMDTFTYIFIYEKMSKDEDK